MAAAREFLALLIPLLIIMDPFGNLPLFLLFTSRNSPGEQKRAAAVASSAAAVILLFFAVTGDIILRFFGISLPAFQIAGGIIFFIYALQLLGLIPGGIKTSSAETKEGVVKDNVALVPLATPMLAGPGAITAVLAWGHGQTGLPAISLLVPAILIACSTVYLVFSQGDRINRLLGVGGIGVITRLTGLILAVIAVQFVVNGIMQI